MKRYFLLFAFFLFVAPGFSQTDNFGSWMTFSFNKGITNRLTFNFDQELRLKDNLTRLNLIYTNLGFTVKVTDFFKISTTYRFIDKVKDDGYFGIRNRLYTDFIFKVKPGKWSLGYRARLQGEWRSIGYGDEYGKVPEVYLRNLFKFGYKLNDQLTPYVGMEMRWQLQNPRLPWGNGFDRTRFFAGTDYQINDKMTAGTYFLYQIEWNREDPQSLYIIGLEFGISID